jgi:hypothetical protein
MGIGNQSHSPVSLSPGKIPGTTSAGDWVGLKSLRLNVLFLELKNLLTFIGHIQFNENQFSKSNYAP